MLSESPNNEFGAVLGGHEITAWDAIKNVIDSFLGKHRSPHYRRYVNVMLFAFNKIGVHMSLKIHFMHHHLDYFEKQLSSESDEQGERYHQVSYPFEMR